jgi:hypothetical protein
MHDLPDVGDLKRFGGKFEAGRAQRAVFERVVITEILVPERVCLCWFCNNSAQQKIKLSLLHKIGTF